MYVITVVFEIKKEQTDAFATAMRNANIKDFSFHTIRHTCMSYLAQMSATPFELKGHGGA